MRRRVTTVLISILLCVLAQPGASGDQGTDFFESRIRPILIKRCYECHSSASADVGGGLLLDSRASIRRGGDRGPAVVPGNVQESLLIDAIRYGTLEMPPDGRLPARTIRDFVAWVKMGAPDSRDTPPDPIAVANEQWTAVLGERLQWWSYQPVQDPRVPEVAHASSAHPIDRFILRKLRAAGLESAAKADPITLVRRLSFQLTGLPPDWSLVEAFQADSSPQAWERLVDHVLASPHLGERWARHWMDVVRYSDTYGYEHDIWARGAWRYRDYLIRAFNADVPFDQLVREHIAGDLLNTPRINHVDEVNESLIGLMFYHMGERRHDDTLVFNGIHQDIVDDQINAFSKAFLGVTMSCSRCHDHKHDPVSQKEYYQLAGVFMSSRWLTNTVDLPERNTKEIASLERIKRDLTPDLADMWANDLGRMDAAVLTRLAEEAALAKKGEGKEKAEAGYDQKKKETSKSPLEDPWFPWTEMASVAQDEGRIADAWTRLAARYRTETTRRRNENADKLRPLWDFRDGIPPGWSSDGVGLRSIVRSGDFTVSLSGESIVGRVLPGGLQTNALSPRLNGAIRSPLLPTFDTKYLSFEYAGGGLAVHRTVFKNEFIAWHQKNLEAVEPRWVSLRTRRELHDHRHYIEFATKTSHTHFPFFACRGCSEEGLADDRSWFGLTRVVAHDEEFTPHDELGRFETLFVGPSPDTLDAVAKSYRRWLESNLSAWTNGTVGAEEVQLLNWMLVSGVLTNRLDHLGADSPIRDRVLAYREGEAQLAEPWTVNGMLDHEEGYDYPLDIRGDYENPGDPVVRGLPHLLLAWGTEQDGVGRNRLALAERVANSGNPLTARVIVNRLWHWLFGRGIVATPNDFGHLGDQPSHPELLDYLATRFVEQGWSVKKLLRAILLSHTWRQSGEMSERASEVDPRNRLLSYYPLRRLEAEAVRDSLFVAADDLDAGLFGRTVFPYHDKETPRRLKKHLFAGPLDGSRRRALYTRVSIMEPPSLLALFNQPDPKIPTGRRDVTSSVSQSLALLNGPLVQEVAERWAKRLVAVKDGSRRARLTRVFRSAFARNPTDDELARWLELVAHLQTTHQVVDADIMTDLAIWKAVCHAVYNTKEFIHVR